MSGKMITQKMISGVKYLKELGYDRNETMSLLRISESTYLTICALSHTPYLYNPLTIKEGLNVSANWENKVIDLAIKARDSKNMSNIYQFRSHLNLAPLSNPYYQH